MMEAITDAVLALSGSGWVPLIVLVFVMIDGFFPPIPGEAVLVATSAIALHGGVGQVLPLFLAGAIGAFLGDNIAYAIGRRVGTTRFAWMRTPKVQQAISSARRGLRKRGTLLVLAGRYIPVGRIAINMTAGATGMDRRRFRVLTAIAGFLWSAHAIIIGMIAGHAAASNPLIGAAIGIGIAIVVSIGVDLGTRIHRAASRRRVREHRRQKEIERDARLSAAATAVSREGSDTGPVPSLR